MASTHSDGSESAEKSGIKSIASPSPAPGMVQPFTAIISSSTTGANTVNFTTLPTELAPLRMQKKISPHAMIVQRSTSPGIDEPSIAPVVCVSLKKRTCWLNC